jgi:6-pyruvoyltetrahydropterin/6-carboxytetrahydropterin synthase
MFELTVEIPFSAAHQIKGHPGPCARLHGHNYRTLVTVAGSDLDDSGLLLDFGELKQLCQDVIAPLDHSYLNDLPAFADINPTAEALARHIYQVVASKLAHTEHSRLQVASVTVYESDRSFATYRE